MSDAKLIERAMPCVAALLPYQPGKPVEELERELGVRNSIKLASNENPRGPGPKVRAAIAAAAEHLSRYPDGSAYQVRMRLASEYQVDPAQITLGNGSNDVLELIARVFLGPGRSGVIGAHAFVVYALAIQASGATRIEVPAKNYGVDLDGMLSAIRADTTVVFIANPNNPTGTWVKHAELTRFLDRVPKNVVVVLDEAYREYVALDDYPEGMQLASAYDNLVVTRTFSKIHGLAALRLGYSVSSPAIADLMNRLRQPFNVNALAQAAALAALDDRDFVAESRRLNQQGLQQLKSGFERLGIPYIDSIGNFICIECGADAARIYDALLREGVIVRPIAGYGLPNHLRITVGLPEENERFLTSLAKVRGR